MIQRGIHYSVNSSNRW